MTLTIGFLGGGNMASALLGGLVRKTEGARLHVTDHNAPKLEKLAALGVTTHETTGDWISECDLFVLAVKPQVMKEALVPVKPLLKRAGPRSRLRRGSKVRFFRAGSEATPSSARCPTRRRSSAPVFRASGSLKAPRPSTPKRRNS